MCSMMNSTKLLYFCFLLTCCTGPGKGIRQPDFIKGVYGNPAALWNKGYDFHSLGINAVFVRSGSLTPEFVERSRKEHVKIFVEFPVLNGKEYLVQHPEAWPITDKGERAVPADWFMGICPTDSGFKADRLNALTDILTAYNVDGIFLDYFHWHAQFETPDPILPETCFCERCVGLFEKYGSVSVPPGKTAMRAQWILQNSEPVWRRWRVAVLTNWAIEAKALIKSFNADLLMGTYHCGWFPADHDSALYRNLGIELPALASVADVLSPMLFHQMKARPVSWVGDYMNWLAKQDWATNSSAPKFWPIVQGHDNPGKVSAAEFKKVLESGALYPSTGVMPFSAESIAGDTAKMKVLKGVYRFGKNNH